MSKRVRSWLTCLFGSVMCCHAMLFSVLTASSVSIGAESEVSIYGNRIYYDTFYGAAGSLVAGTVPDVSPNGEQWAGADSWFFTSAGTACSTSTPSSVYLDFVPENGKVYTWEVSLRIDDRIGNEPPFAFGFISSNNLSSAMNWWQNSDSPWISITPSVSYPAGNARAYAGSELIDTMPVANVDELGFYQVVLDTTDSHWVAHFNVRNGYDVESVASWVYTNASPDIVAVGFGQSGLSTVYGEINSVELTIRNRRPKLVFGSTYTYMPGLGKDNNLQWWPTVRSKADSVSIHINRLGHPVHMYTDPDYSNMVNVLNANAIGISSESGNMNYDSLDPDSSGLDGGITDAGYLTELYDRGGHCDAVHLDGFIRRLRYYDNGTNVVSTGKSYSWIAGQIEDYIGQILSVDSNIVFYLLEQLPNWGWDGDKAYQSFSGSDYGWGDLKEACGLVLDQLLTNGYPVCGVTIDSPYDFTTAAYIPPASVYVDDPSLINWWDRMKQIESLSEGKGLEFNLIFNSMTPAQTYQDSEEYYRQSLQYISDYKSLGGSPSQYFLHSWYHGVPADMMPENEGASLTALAKSGIYLSKYRGQHDEFHRDDDYNGWTNAANLSVCAATNGYLCGYTSSEDPQVVSLSTNLFPAWQVPRMQIRMLADAGTAGEIFWKTDFDNTFTGDKRIAFNVQADGLWHLYDISLIDYEDWRGTITGLRIDPVNQSNAYFEIDYIHLFYEPGWEFSAGTNTLGWSGVNVTGLTTTNDSLCAISSSGDPQFRSPDVEFDAAENRTVEIRMKTSSGSVGQLFFKTSHDPTFNTTQRKDFSISSDGSFHTYILDMGNVESWIGNITALRVDPTLSSGCDIEIDRIRVLE